MMRQLFIAAALLSLPGCISVYGPVKPGGQQQTGSLEQQTGGQLPDMSGSGTSVQIGNRQPDELFNAVMAYFQQKGMKTEIQDIYTGIVATIGDDPELSSLYLDCSMLEQTQNIREQYRIVAQVWSAGEGANVAVSVSGVAGLMAADGNDKVKPVACKSTGIFEKDLLEKIRK